MVKADNLYHYTQEKSHDRDHENDSRYHQCFKKRKPSTLTKESDKPLSSQQAVKQLAPILLAKRQEGLTTAELVSFLAEHGIIVKASNLTRSLRKYSIDNGIQKSDTKNETSSDQLSNITYETVG